MGAPAITQVKKPVPKSATIIIQNHQPDPSGEVEVVPGGRIIFLNEDKSDYCLRLFKPGTDPATGFGVLLPGNGRHTVLIAPNDEFMYEVWDVDASGVAVSPSALSSSSFASSSFASPSSGSGGGPIKN